MSSEEVQEHSAMEDFSGISEVAQWYDGKTIFISGGTGFLGKVLIEKLLRTCNVRNIYVLIREKKGMDVKSRAEEMLSYQLFDTIKATKPEVLRRVIPVKGDITHEGLGISEEDEETLLREVSVIFHAAATINFQEPMRVAVNMNLVGTRRMVCIAKKMPHLKAFVHVSTAYGNCHLPEIVEELYPPPMDPAKLIKMTEWLDDEMLGIVTPRLIHPRPNTYTYTKALAEHLLLEEGDKLPLVIIRPSIVCGAWREPAHGWVDNMFAFTGLMIGMGKGFLRSLYLKPGIKIDFIPVDIPINLMIVAAWNAEAKKFIHNGPVPVYCACTSSQKPLTADKLQDILRSTVWQVPLDSPLWFPDGSAKSRKFLHNIHVYAVNIIPSYIGDLVLRIVGKKPVAMKLCNRMIKAIGALEYFMLRDWTFSNANVVSLWNTISSVDKESFHFDISDLDWTEYIRRYQIGCKKFLLKENIDDLPTARKTLKNLYWLHKFTQIVLYYGVWCIISSETAVDLYSLFLETAAYFLSMASSLSPVLAAAEET